MEPEVPDVRDFDMPLPGAPDPERAEYEALLRMSDERKASLERLQMSVKMLKEMHNATVAAFREELQRSVRLRLEVEMRATQDNDESESRIKNLLALVESNAVREVKRMNQFYSMLHRCEQLMLRVHPSGVRIEDSVDWLTAVKDAGELLAVAAEYLD